MELLLIIYVPDPAIHRPMLQSPATVRHPAALSSHWFELMTRHPKAHLQECPMHRSAGEREMRRRSTRQFTI